MSKRKSNTASLHDVLDRFLRQHGLQEGMDRVRIKNAWPELMGGMISAHTKEITLKDGKLTLTVDSAPLRQELSFARQKIKELLNEHLARQVVKEVELR